MSSNSHNLIPEKGASFSSKKGIYFDGYLKQFETHLDAPVPEFKAWEDETVLLTLKNKNVTLSALDTHKLIAFKNFDSTNCSITTPLEFSNIATILNDDIPITDYLDTIEPAYVAWAIEILERHDSNHEIEITDEVEQYIVMCFFEEGFLSMPKSLEIFNERLLVYNNSVLKDDASTSKINRVDDYVKAKRSELSKKDS